MNKLGAALGPASWTLLLGMPVWCIVAPNLPHDVETVGLIVISAAGCALLLLMGTVVIAEVRKDKRAHENNE